VSFGSPSCGGASQEYLRAEAERQNGTPAPRGSFRKKVLYGSPVIIIDPEAKSGIISVHLRPRS